MPSNIVPVGNGSITITSEAFLDGFQAGHLAYMVDGRAVQFSDERLTTLFLEKLESMDYSSLYSMGYIVGWIATLAHKGTQVQEGQP